MLRIALFSLLLTFGANLFKGMGWLALDEAILVASAGTVLIMFAIPDRKERRDPKKLIFSLLLVLAVYVIALKFGHGLLASQSRFADLLRSCR